ncbi:alpha/beta hydrolase [Microlunatus ginsengisoli]|uniref:Alpha/beta hydrolase n=1 Tax=Microlunatus ginsengisoli TaxID=363863 RepID=A0ABP7A416_9ACTN
MSTQRASFPGRPTWESDFLPGYESLDLPLPDAARAAGEPPDVEMVGTLIRRVPTSSGRPDHSRAVLFLHGWNDYFFQTHVADRIAELGFDFFALDLRRYGRSLRNGHLRGFITNLDDYAEEIDQAVEVIAADHDGLVLMGHSTGGLIAALWAASHPDKVVALALDSPWLDLQGSAMVRAIGTPVVDALGRQAPTSIIPLPDLGFYARTLHASLEGEWDYDLELKSSPSPPIRAGWLRAIRQGHQRVAAGLGLPMPVLVMASAATEFARKWHEGLRSADTVLDVDQIVSRGARLGRHVTIVRIDGGLHDLFLSPRPVREVALFELERWLQAYAFEEPPVRVLAE